MSFWSKASNWCTNIIYHTTLLQSIEPGEFNTLPDTSTSDDKNDDNPNENEDNPKKHNIKTYPTMLN